MKKALISRHGAYGDILHMSFLPRLLKDKGFEVTVDTNFKGYQLLSLNPFIKKIFNAHPSEHSLLTQRSDLMQKHYQVLAQGYDKFINLNGSIEGSCIAMEDDEVYYMSDVIRRHRYGGLNFYDTTCAWAGYLDEVGKYKGEVFYEIYEEKAVKAWIERFEEKFLLMVNMSGTGPHKRFVQAPDFIEWVLKTYEDVIVIQTGDFSCKNLEIVHPKIKSIIGSYPFRQALLIAKYVDCVIGCESGLMVGADMWGTPAIQLLTAANHINHCKYAPTDKWIQSPVACSPCHKGPYDYIGCPHREGNPACVYFNLEDIKKNFEEIYVARSRANALA